jgi:hypothetical protein
VNLRTGEQRWFGDPPGSDEWQPLLDPVTLEPRYRWDINPETGEQEWVPADDSWDMPGTSQQEPPPPPPSLPWPLGHDWSRPRRAYVNMRTGEQRWFSDPPDSGEWKPLVDLDEKEVPSRMWPTQPTDGAPYLRELMSAQRAGIDILRIGNQHGLNLSAVMEEGRPYRYEDQLAAAANDVMEMRLRQRGTVASGGLFSVFDVVRTELPPPEGIVELPPVVIGELPPADTIELPPSD